MTPFSTTSFDLAFSGSVFFSFFHKLAILLTTAVFFLGSGFALASTLTALDVTESFGLFSTPDDADLALADWAGGASFPLSRGDTRCVNKLPVEAAFFAEEADAIELALPLTLAVETLELLAKLLRLVLRFLVLEEMVGVVVLGRT